MADQHTLTHSHTLKTNTGLSAAEWLHPCGTDSEQISIWLQKEREGKERERNIEVDEISNVV